MAHVSLVSLPVQISFLKNWRLGLGTWEFVWQHVNTKTTAACVLRAIWHLRTCILFQTNTADSLILLFRTVLTNLWALAAQYRVCILLWRIALSRRPGFKGVPSSSNYNNISICVDDGLNFLQTHSKHDELDHHLLIIKNIRNKKYITTDCLNFSFSWGYKAPKQCYFSLFRCPIKSFMADCRPIFWSHKY